MKQHCNGDSQVISKAIQKYGKENFKFEIIHNNIPIEEIDDLEMYYINEIYGTYKNKGYNFHIGGNCNAGENNPMYGVSLSGEQSGMYGRKRSKELKEKLRQLKKGSKQSEEVKLKISKKTKGSNNPRSKIKMKDVFPIIKLYFEEDLSGYEIADKYNMSSTAIYEVINCNHWTTKDLKTIK